MARAAALAAPLLLAGLLWLLFDGHAFLNYDTSYAVLWGDELAQGRTPEIDFALAPTPHPLAELAGMVLGERGFELGSFVFLGIVGFLVFRLGALWFGWPAGVVAAAVFLTREPVLSFGVRAYLDLPYLALVLGALLVEARRPRAGVPVLVLLALAGLLRPEAWLLSAAYVVYLRRWELLALAAAAPALWGLHDLLLTGSPVHSLTGTRESADVLGRRTGLDDLPLYGPRRLGEVLREPVLVGAAAGGLLALAWLRERARLPALAGAVAVVAFALLAAAGLPIITRYLLLPAALLSVFCGAALFGWRCLPDGDRRRRPWLALAALTAVLLVAFAPAQARRLDRLEDSIATQERILDDLDALPAAALRCAPLAVTNRRPIPHLALGFGVAPQDVLVGAPPRARTYVGPASRRVAEEFVFDARDPVRVLPRLPPGFARVAGNRSWTVLSRC
jgi:hypothetical protein